MMPCGRCGCPALLAIIGRSSVFLAGLRFRFRQIDVHLLYTVLVKLLDNESDAVLRAYLIVLLRQPVVQMLDDESAKRIIIL